MSSPRKYDVVVHGATGYTGRLVSQYFTKAPSASKTKWAICGRSRERLNELVEQCIDPEQNFHKTAAPPNKPDVIVADSTNAADMAALVASTRLVIACAGPFTLLGKELVDACVAAKTHYVDITGEFPFVRAVIEKHHAAAQRDGLFIVPCCGFDCVPSDLANVFAHDLAAEAGINARHVEAAFRINGGGASRGTLESVLTIKDAIRRKDLSPLSLVDEADREGVEAPKVSRPRYSKGFQSWVGPFIMAATNERVVRRSNSLIPARKTASYVEMARGTLVQMVLMSLTMFMMVLLFVPGLQKLIRTYVFPASRGGPKSTKGSWVVDVAGYVSSTSALPAVTGRIYSGLPPYPFTAVSVVETALAIVAGETEVGTTGGVLTPAVAAGKSLKSRLVQSGYVSFSNTRK